MFLKVCFTAYNLLTWAFIDNQDFISFDFSSDGKFMIAQAGGPHYKLIMWSMEGKTKILATVGTSTNERDPVYQCSMSPDNKVICVTGNGIFKLFKYDDGALKLITSSIANNKVHKDSNEEYMYHTWLDEKRLVISNRNGDLFIVENLEFKCMVPSAPSDGKAINIIIPYNKVTVVKNVFTVSNI
jgi:WD40 repeat protein